MLDRILEQAGIIPDDKYNTIAGNRVSNVVGTIAENIQETDNEAVDVLNKPISTIVGTIVGNLVESFQKSDTIVEEILNGIESTTTDIIVHAIKQVLTERDLKLLLTAKQPVNRDKLLAGINLQNQLKNYNENVKPLMDSNWITMTIPDKPTSSRQQYITTLKGRLILKSLNIK